jgi:hypothetical protein
LRANFQLTVRVRLVLVAEHVVKLFGQQGLGGFGLLGQGSHAAD